jgi:hypothetical protein
MEYNYTYPRFSTATEAILPAIAAEVNQGIRSEGDREYDSSLFRQPPAYPVLSFGSDGGIFRGPPGGCYDSKQRLRGDAFCYVPPGSNEEPPPGTRGRISVEVSRNPVSSLVHEALRKRADDRVSRAAFRRSPDGSGFAKLETAASSSYLLRTKYGFPTQADPYDPAKVRVRLPFDLIPYKGEIFEHSKLAKVQGEDDEVWVESFPQRFERLFPKTCFPDQKYPPGLMTEITPLFQNLRNQMSAFATHFLASEFEDQWELICDLVGQHLPELWGLTTSLGCAPRILS